MLLASLPYYLGQSFCDMLGVSFPSPGFLLAPRIFALFLSFIIDVSTLRLSRACGCSPYYALLCLSSSWPVVLLHSRPFSNTLESVILSILLMLWLSPPHFLSPAGSACFAGALLGLGFFIRFTILFFACPLLLISLATDLTRIPQPALFPSSCWRWLLRLNPCRQRVPTVWGLTIGGMLAVAALTLCDSIYFGALALAPPGGALLQGRLVLPPLNSLRYNLQSSNLAQHGLHPRLTHLLLNLPILFGPLPFLLLLAAYRATAAGPLFRQRRDTSTSRDRGGGRGGARSPRSSSSGGGRRGGARRGSQAGKQVSAARSWSKDKGAGEREGEQDWRLGVAGACGAAGLGLLSAAPHQEPRFLLPLCLPAALLAARCLQATGGAHSGGRWVGWWGAVWLLFNVGAGGVFGVLHQGGVVPALLWLTAQRGAAARSLLWYKTYMPPAASLLLAPAALERRRGSGSGLSPPSCCPHPPQSSLPPLYN